MTVELLDVLDVCDVEFGQLLDPGSSTWVVGVVRSARVVELDVFEEVLVAGRGLRHVEKDLVGVADDPNVRVRSNGGDCG